MPSSLESFTYSESSVLKSDFLFTSSVAECADPSVCTAFSVVKICHGEVAVLLPLEMGNT